MRPKGLHMLVILLIIIIMAIFASVSVPLSRAEENFPPVSIGDREGYPTWQLVKSSVDGSGSLSISDSMALPDKEMTATLYGTGILDTKEDYLIGVKISFKIKNWGNLGRIITGVFHKSNERCKEKGVARVCVVLDGPDH